MKTNEAANKMTLGEKLRSARKDAGLTQEQLAKKAACIPSGDYKVGVGHGITGY